MRDCLSTAQRSKLPPLGARHSIDRMHRTPLVHSLIPSNRIARSQPTTTARAFTICVTALSLQTLRDWYQTEQGHRSPSARTGDLYRSRPCEGYLLVYFGHTGTAAIGHRTFRTPERREPYHESPTQFRGVTSSLFDRSAHGTTDAVRTPSPVTGKLSVCCLSSLRSLSKSARRLWPSGTWMLPFIGRFLTTWKKTGATATDVAMFVWRRSILSLTTWLSKSRACVRWLSAYWRSR